MQSFNPRCCWSDLMLPSRHSESENPDTRCGKWKVVPRHFGLHVQNCKERRSESEHLQKHVFSISISDNRPLQGHELSITWYSWSECNHVFHLWKLSEAFTKPEFYFIHFCCWFSCWVDTGLLMASITHPF